MQSYVSMWLNVRPICIHKWWKWSIAGDLNGQNPNILSEVSWKDLGSTGFKIETEVPFKKQFLSKLNFWIYYGKELISFNLIKSYFTIVTTENKHYYITAST